MALLMSLEVPMRPQRLLRITAILASGALAGSLTGCDEPSRVTSPDGAIRSADALVANQRTDVDTVLTNFCTGEDVHLVGTSHFVLSLAVDGHGGFHLAFTSTQQLNGLGLTTSATYRSLSSNSFTLNVPGLPFEQTSVGSSRLLRQGAGGDIKALFLQHITVDAKGNTRVFNTDFRFSCS
jgi:hypothetical protein